ncbi:MAG: Cof-type HAD-IIB family hydrolase [Ruminococcus sp.]|jgi:Cof subfamily protein (haloacid dehalogenase superfamily)|nr:Cof-type HAD-IIB family hydrolase [Ruminococcus sp.]
MFNPEKTVIISDVDGTFITHSKEYIKRNLDAVKKFQEQGGRFTLATGRVLQAAEHFFDGGFINFPAILGNGSMIYDTHERKILWNRNLSPDVFPIICEIAEKFPEISVEIDTPDSIIVCRMTPYEKDHIKAAKFKTYRELPLKEAANLEIVKTLFAGHPDTITKLCEYQKNQDWQQADFVRSHETFFEVLPRGCNKGTALKRIKEMPGMSDCYFVAIGDFYNDLEMLEAADYAACPGDAIDDVKAVCDYVCESGYEDGAIAELITEIRNQKSDVRG